MLSSTGYQAIGAGTASANGAYRPLTGASAMFDGAQQFSNNTEYIMYSSRQGCFVVWSTVNGGDAANGGFGLYQSPATPNTVMPLTGWTAINSNFGAAPTFEVLPSAPVGLVSSVIY